MRKAETAATDKRPAAPYMAESYKCGKGSAER
jgi:hypothetical protein